VKVEQKPFCSVPEEHALKEGEGDRSLRGWKIAHEEFFRAELSEKGLAFSFQMPIVLEEFELVYPLEG